MSRTTALIAELEEHVSADAREERARRRILAFLRWLPSPFDQAADPTHVTVSAIIRDVDRVLLHQHRRLGIWLQPGGHIEGTEDPREAVVREVREETGLEIEGAPGGPPLIHVDVHEGGRGHIHLDLRYLIEADASRSLRPEAGESERLAWFSIEEAVARTDISARAAIEASTRWGEGATRG